MKNQLLEEFIKYAKREFGCDIDVKKSDFPDSIESIFGCKELTKKRYLTL